MQEQAHIERAEMQDRQIRPISAYRRTRSDLQSKFLSSWADPRNLPKIDMYIRAVPTPKSQQWKQSWPSYATQPRRSLRHRIRHYRLNHLRSTAINIEFPRNKSMDRRRFCETTE